MGAAAPSIPPAKRGGRPREVNLREVLNAILYVLSTGCQWKALPKDLPPKSTAHAYFMLWEWDGTEAAPYSVRAVPAALHRQAFVAALGGKPKCLCISPFERKRMYGGRSSVKQILRGFSSVGDSPA